MLLYFLFHLLSLEMGHVSTYPCSFPWKCSAHVQLHPCHSFNAIFFCPKWEAKVGKCSVACLSLFLPNWISKPLWLCGPGWLFSHGSGTLLDCPSSGYRPHSTHLFASPSISLHWWSSISSSSAKISTQDGRDIDYPLVIFIQILMHASLGETWVWSRLRKRLAHSAWDLRTPPLSQQDEVKFCWRCFTEARDPDPCISASLTHTGEWGTLVQCAALFNSLMRY